MGKKRVYGWVIEDTQEHYYILRNGGGNGLKNADVYLTRAKARQVFRLVQDVIRKVSLDDKGSAIAIVPGR